MKTRILPYVLLMVLSMVINAMEVQGQELNVSDTQNSGCLSRAPSDDGEERPISTIVLEKEGNILSVQLLNIESNCATSDFVVTSRIDEGSDGQPCTLFINADAVVGEFLTSCTCQFNVSCTIHDVEPNVFYLDCWWYKGLVELTEGEPLVLADVYEEATIEGLNFTLRKAFHQASVKKNEWTGEVCLPAEVSYEGQTYAVTSIDRYAFKGDTTLTKVTLPRTIRSIDFIDFADFADMAWYNIDLFYGCSALKSIEVEEENPFLCSVDGVLFDKEKTILFAYPAAASRTSYTVPESVTSIETYAFTNNPHLVTVSMSDNVTDLGAYAFKGCTNLEEVELSSNLKKLIMCIFRDCPHLKTVTIPEGVTFLGFSLFAGCTSLTSVEMPESVTKGEEAIFENCTSLKSVTLSPNLDLIYHRMFLNCSSLSEIQIPKSVTGVRTNAFKNCTSLKTLDLPESVCDIGWSSFEGCKFDSLLIRGIVNSNWINEWFFSGMDTRTKVYVQPSEVEKYQKVYQGTVYPLTDEMNGISDIISPVNNSSELFDLQGRRLHNAPAKGVYIKNGKKLIK
ncbi:MAG: leucine-rich repeat domain-containing protein [Prevotella sp.]|nr:leucine-rich repeat domain-containing protein [Prevotella sp.]